MAPVPPSCPEMSTTSEWALATPAATVPTPTSATSFTWTRARGIGRLEVVDELGDVLDGVDVVVGRRGDEADPGGRVAGLGDPRGRPCGPGSWPPSPGLAPWAILIWMSSELTRYSEVTPNRPEATCLMALRRRSPLASGVKRSGSSPPSPVLDRPPSRFMAMARVSWASAEIDP